MYQEIPIRQHFPLNRRFFAQIFSVGVRLLLMSWDDSCRSQGMTEKIKKSKIIKKNPQKRAENYFFREYKGYGNR
jgi:hypothetical protein